MVEVESVGEAKDLEQKDEEEEEDSGEGEIEGLGGEEGRKRWWDCDKRDGGW